MDRKSVLIKKVSSFRRALYHVHVGIICMYDYTDSIELGPEEYCLICHSSPVLLSHLEVRSAAVSSMCQLGTRCRSFAAQCVDFLVDMFNDEIQSVRSVQFTMQVHLYNCKFVCVCVCVCV